MAHVGKFYKLQFRRDLSSVTNNTQAWPEGATWSVVGLGGVVGHLLNNNPIRVYNLLTDSQPPMVWTSDIEVVAGIPIVYHVTLYDPWILGEASFEFGITHALSGVILFHQPQSGPSINGSRSNAFWFGTFPDLTTPEINAPLGKPDAAFKALPWSSYNP
jgi:hypothetical protein